jgi:hypothetical protein
MPLPVQLLIGRTSTAELAEKPPAVAVILNL